MTGTMKLAIAGVAGRMGRQLASAAVEAGHTLTGASEAPGSDALGAPLANLVHGAPDDVEPQSDVAKAASGADVRRRTCCGTTSPASWSATICSRAASS